MKNLEFKTCSAIRGMSTGEMKAVIGGGWAALWVAPFLTLFSRSPKKSPEENSKNINNYIKRRRSTHII